MVGKLDAFTMVEYMVWRLRPVREDSDAQSKLSFVSILPEHFFCDNVFGKNEDREVETICLKKNAYQFVLDPVDRNWQTTSANSVIGKFMSCFGPEVLYGGDDCYTFEKFRLLVDKLEEHVWLTVTESEEAMNKF